MLLRFKMSSGMPWHKIVSKNGELVCGMRVHWSEMLYSIANLRHPLGMNPMLELVSAKWVQAGLEAIYLHLQIKWEGIYVQRHQWNRKLHGQTPEDLVLIMSRLCDDYSRQYQGHSQAWYWPLFYSQQTDNPLPFTQLHLLYYHGLDRRWFPLLLFSTSPVIFP